MVQCFRAGDKCNVYNHNPDVNWFSFYILTSQNNLKVKILLCTLGNLPVVCLKYLDFFKHSK